MKSPLGGNGQGKSRFQEGEGEGLQFESRSHEFTYYLQHFTVYNSFLGLQPSYHTLYCGEYLGPNLPTASLGNANFASLSLYVSASLGAIRLQPL